MVRSRASRGGRRRRSERGAALAEFAVGVPLFLLVIFGLIEFGIAWSSKHSISTGVRETARQGVVNNFATDDCAGSTLDTLACAAQDRINLGDGLGVRVEITGTGIGDQLSVCASYTYNAIAGIMNPFLDGRDLDAGVTMRVEQVLSGVSGSSATVGANPPASCST